MSVPLPRQPVFGADLCARFEALVAEDQLSAIAAISAPFNSAVLAFERGEIGERELLAIGLAVNRAVGELPGGPGPIPSLVAEAEMMRRVGELDRESS
jgi:hypothetical protein